MSDPANTFFRRLRKTAQTTERGVQQLQKDFETKNTDRCAASAVKFIDLKKEVKELKEQARGTTLTLQKAGSEFDLMLSLTSSLIDIQTHKLTEIQSFMSQYGYIPKETGAIKKEVGSEEGKSPENGEIHTPQQTPKSVKATLCHTPKLEDFGLSRVTMKAIYDTKRESKYGFSSNKQTPQAMRVTVSDTPKHTSKPVRVTVSDTPQQAPKPVKATASHTPKLEDFGLSRVTMKAVYDTERENKYGFSCTKTQMRNQYEDSSIPSVFRHNGLIVTPSIMDGKMSTMTPCSNRDFMNQYGSPMVQPKFDDSPPELKSALEKPPTPEFLTPSVKRMMQKADDNQIRAYKGPEQNLESPEPPVFATPAMNKRFEKEHIKNSTQKRKFTMPPKMASFSDTIQTPQTPELTCNFQALSDITSTYLTRETNAEPSKQYPVPQMSKVANYHLEMPQTPEFTCNFQSLHQKGFTDDPGDFTSTHGQSKTQLVTPELESLSTDKEISTNLNMRTYTAPVSLQKAPDTPQFLCNYRLKKQ